MDCGSNNILGTITENIVFYEEPENMLEKAEDVFEECFCANCKKKYPARYEKEIDKGISEEFLQIYGEIQNGFDLAEKLDSNIPRFSIFQDSYTLLWSIVYITFFENKKDQINHLFSEHDGCREFIKKINQKISSISAEEDFTEETKKINMLYMDLIKKRNEFDSSKIRKIGRDLSKRRQSTCDFSRKKINNFNGYQNDGREY